MGGVADVWSDAASAALDFWARVGAEARISAEFRAIARNNHTVVARMLHQFG